MPAGTTRAFRSPWTFGCHILHDYCHFDLREAKGVSCQRARPGLSGPPSGSIVALLRYRSHCSFSPASFTPPIPASGGVGVTEPWTFGCHLLQDYCHFDLRQAKGVSCLQARLGLSGRPGPSGQPPPHRPIPPQAGAMLRSYGPSGTIS